MELNKNNKEKDLSKTKRNNIQGITLIALVVTIIVLIILAGVTINLIIGENGIITKVKQAKIQNEEVSAMEKLQIALLDLQVNKELDSNYNENEYINDYLENLGMLVVENIVTVDGWNFTINRQELTIQSNLGQTQVQVESKIIEYLGKNENGKNLALVQLEIKSNIKIEKIELYNPDGTITQRTPQESETIEQVQLELDEEYLIKITTTDGKEEMKNIMEKTKEMVAITIPYIGTRETTVKVIDVINEENVENYTYILDDTEITTNTDKEYTFSNLGEKTTHKIKVIANYKDETKVESIEKTIETEPRTYLYNNGDQCEEITGGWVKAFSAYSGTGEKKNTYLYCYSPIRQGVFSSYYFRTANKINLQEYKNLCFEVSVILHSNGSGGHHGIFGAWNGTEYIYYYDMIAHPKFSIGSMIDTTISNEIVIININELNEELYITGGITSGGASDSISANIYEVWLEK